MRWKPSTPFVLVEHPPTVLVCAAPYVRRHLARSPCSTFLRVLLDPKEGFERHAVIDTQDVKRVLGNAREVAEPKKALSEASSYYDSRYCDAAVRR